MGKARFESPGGLYHVLNRGGTIAAGCSSRTERRRRVIRRFASRCVAFSSVREDAAQRAPACLAPSRGYAIFTLPRSIQGRFKSLVVEDIERLGWLCHYIHLNPVRAGICQAAALKAYRYSSYYHLWDRRNRPKPLDLAACLEGAGGLKDTPAGRRKYGEYLEWLAEDEPRQKALLFDRMSQGWALGTTGFKKALLEDGKALRSCLELGVDDAREMRELAWEGRLDRCLAEIGKGRTDLEADPKSADWKIAVACYMKKRLLCRNGWLAERLNMGAESAVARYCSEFFRGGRSGARHAYERLNAGVLD